MQLKSSLFALVFAVVLFACKEKNSGTKIEIEGEVKNIEAVMAQ